MSNNYKQNPVVTSSQTHFNNAPVDELQFSRMVATPMHLTTFDAGEIVPIRCFEVLPNDTFDINLDFVIRQNTIVTPTMGELFVDFYAYFVPNRIVNDSWVNVMGENTSGMWTAPSVQLAPLGKNDVQIPVGSVADHYGYPTQGTLKGTLLEQMHDLKFKGYLACFNEFFRDQNWQPPIPYSKLNIYQGFLEDRSQIAQSTHYVVNSTNDSADGSEGAGALVKAIMGDGGKYDGTLSTYIPWSPFSALDKPLKANKFHDMFTSCLPSPQKSSEVTISASGELPVVTGSLNSDITMDNPAMTFLGVSTTGGTIRNLAVNGPNRSLVAGNQEAPSPNPYSHYVLPNNLYARLAEVELLSVNELRMSSALQRVYELLARGGSRYREFINNFFGLDTDNPFMDIPTQLGHFRRKLDLFQTAQTSASQEGETPQGNLSAFGYTATGGHLFTKTFLEHGYVHVFAIVRHQNIYSSMLAKDNFRMTQLDYYMHPLANISEQPIYTYEINPFAPNPEGVFGYNEAWCQYRDEPNTCSGLMRSGVTGSLDLWNYADDFDQTLTTVDGGWLRSNTASVVDRTLAIKSDFEPQFKGQFVFTVDKQRAMPIYSVPAVDLI